MLIDIERQMSEMRYGDVVYHQGILQGEIVMIFRERLIHER